MKFLYVILLMPMASLCQKSVNIQYNEALQLEIGSGHYQFNFTENGSQKSLNEIQLSAYMFKFPGRYDIAITEMKDKKETVEDCLHLHLPEKMILSVDSIQIHFIGSSIRTSQDLFANRSTEGIDLFIDVDVLNFLGDKVQLNSSIVTTAGIGSSITASLDSSFYHISEGRHTLTYHLKGVCSEASYIQFDFLAPNGNIYPIALKNPVKN